MGDSMSGMNFTGLGAGSTMAISGGNDLVKANKREKRLGKRPIYAIPGTKYDNLYMAENNAQMGISDAAKEVYTSNANRGYATGIDALLKTGGGINSVSSLYDTFANNAAQLAIIDDQARFNHQQVLAATNNEMSDEIDKSFQFNTYAPWVDEKQAIAELRALGNAKKMGGSAVMAGSGGSASYNQPQRRTETPITDVNDGNNSRRDNWSMQDYPQQREPVQMPSLNSYSSRRPDAQEYNDENYILRSFYEDKYGY